MTHSRKNILLLLDILVQIGLVLLAVYYQKYYSVLLVFIGAAWQMVSNFCHLQYSPEYQKTRKVYLKWALGVLVVLTAALLLFLIAIMVQVQFFMMLVLLCLVISLVGGVVLYTVYLYISVAHFVSLNLNEGTITQIDNDHES